MRVKNRSCPAVFHFFPSGFEERPCHHKIATVFSTTYFANPAHSAALVSLFPKLFILPPKKSLQFFIPTIGRSCDFTNLTRRPTCGRRSPSLRAIAWLQVFFFLSVFCPELLIFSFSFFLSRSSPFFLFSAIPLSSYFSFSDFFLVKKKKKNVTTNLTMLFCRSILFLIDYLYYHPRFLFVFYPFSFSFVLFFRFFFFFSFFSFRIARLEVERLFRARKLMLVIATGTLAMGIHMPCKTVIFAGDTVHLTPVQYLQVFPFAFFFVSFLVPLRIVQFIVRGGRKLMLVIASGALAMAYTAVQTCYF
jgi:hypothetical protein